MDDRRKCALRVQTEQHVRILSTGRSQHVVWDSEYWRDGETRFGANIGLGAEVYATREFSIGLEAKYNIIKDVDQAMIGLRAAYCFWAVTAEVT